MRLYQRSCMAFGFQHRQPIGFYIADFFCPVTRLVIELDGGWHGEDLVRIEDEHHIAYLQRLGYTIPLFWNNEATENVREVLQRVAEHLF